MIRIRLSKNEKLVLRLLAGGNDCHDSFPLHAQKYDVMTKEEALKIAMNHTLNNGGDYALFAGEQDNWFYFACGLTNAPKYSSLPWAIRINNNGDIYELKGIEIRQEVSRNAHLLNP